MPAREEVKIMATRRQITLKQLAQRLSEHYNKKYSAQNFSQKLRKDTIPFKEVEDIAKILGFKIIFQDLLEK